MSSEPSADFEHEPESHSPRHAGFKYAVGRSVARPLAKLVYRPRIEGRENVPRDGAVILASNHLSFIDSMAIPVAAPRPVHLHPD
jgi:1-acyl-sn-glycerol-3-phosphate acyltransferase